MRIATLIWALMIALAIQHSKLAPMLRLQDRKAPS